MRIIDRITDAAAQRFVLTTDDGTQVDLRLRYLPTQESWFADIQVGDFCIKNRRIVSDVNLLRQHNKRLTFGLLCETTNGQDPMRLDDFLLTNSSLFILNAQEVADIEAALF